jgi:hypothetical protein
VFWRFRPSEWHSEGREFDPPQLHFIFLYYQAFPAIKKNRVYDFLGTFIAFFWNCGHKMVTNNLAIKSRAYKKLTAPFYNLNNFFPPGVLIIFSIDLTKQLDNNTYTN